MKRKNYGKGWRKIQVNDKLWRWRVNKQGTVILADPHDEIIKVCKSIVINYCFETISDYECWDCCSQNFAVKPSQVASYIKTMRSQV